MSSPTSVQNGPNQNSFWNTYIVPNALPPLAAGAAIVPVMYGFQAKSALQLGKPIPDFAFNNAFKAGMGAAPTIAAIIGTQMVAQRVIEETLAGSKNEEKKEDFKAIFASAMAVAALSAPGFAVFNGLTMNPKQSWKTSLQKLTPQQTLAIVGRESCFLLSLRISEPISQKVEKEFKNNLAAKYGSVFMTGAVGSIFGHPADTALSLLQNGNKILNGEKPVELLLKLSRGWHVRAVTAGGFTLVYNVVKDVFGSLGK